MDVVDHLFSKFQLDDMWVREHPLRELPHRVVQSGTEQQPLTVVWKHSVNGEMAENIKE